MINFQINKPFNSYYFCGLYNIASRHEACEERKVSSERADRMRAELESVDIRLEEERKRSAELLLQVTHIHCHLT